MTEEDGFVRRCGSDPVLECVTLGADRSRWRCGRGIALTICDDKSRFPDSVIVYGGKVRL